MKIPCKFLIKEEADEESREEFGIEFDYSCKKYSLLMKKFNIVSFFKPPDPLYIIPESDCNIFCQYYKEKK